LAIKIHSQDIVLLDMSLASVLIGN